MTLNPKMILTWLRSLQFRRRLVVCRVIWDGFISRMSWNFIKKDSTDPNDIQNLNRLKYFYQWLSPEMEQHWQTYENDPTFHNRKNLGSERFRLDAQLAYKDSSYWLIIGYLLLAISLVVNILLCIL